MNGILFRIFEYVYSPQLLYVGKYCMDASVVAKAVISHSNILQQSVITMNRELE